MSYPKFVKNIMDNQTVTLNNRVGAENKGNVAITGINELIINSMPVTLGENQCTNLQEILQYVKDYNDANSGNEYDVVTIDIDYAFTEMNVVIPNNVILQVANEKNASININNWIKLRRDYADVEIQDKNCVCVFGKEKDKVAIVLKDTNKVLEIKSSNSYLSFIEHTRSIASGQTYRAIAGNWYYSEGAEEYGLITNGNANQLDLIQGNTYRDTITNVKSNTSNKTKMRILYYDDYTGTDYLYFYITAVSNSSIIKVVRDVSNQFYTQFPIYPKDENNNNILSKDGNWEIIQNSSNGGRYPVNYPSDNYPSHIIGLVYTGSEKDKTYLYNGIDFTDNDIVGTILGKMDSLVFCKYSNGNSFNFTGGSKIVKYDGSDFIIEKTFLDDYNSSKFVPILDNYGNVLDLFFIIETSEKISLWKRGANGTWVLQQTYYNDLMPLVSNWKGYEILLKDGNDKIHFHIGFIASIFLSESSELRGFICNYYQQIMINDNNVWGKKYIIYPAYNEVGDYANLKINYCSIYSNIAGINYIAYIWKTNNCIVNIQNTILSINVSTVQGDCRNNLFISSNDWVLKAISGGNITITGNFQNNTIICQNGLNLSNITITSIKNLIMIASNVVIQDKDNSTVEIVNSLINGVLQFNENNLYNCIRDVNPLFININNNYRLMSKAGNYPKDSLALGFGDDGKDLGCYDVIYMNNGENPTIFELTAYAVDIGLSWEYPKKETGFDYKAGYIKSMGERIRVLHLLEQIGGLTKEISSYMEYLISLDEVLRFYPFGDDGIPYVIDKTNLDKFTYKQSESLTIDFTNLNALASTNHNFEMGFLKGAWLQFTYNSNDYFYYIRENDTTKLYLENKKVYTNPPDGTYICKVLWFYVKISDSVQYLNNIWYSDNQKGKFPAVKLYVVEDKNR